MGRAGGRGGDEDCRTSPQALPCPVCRRTYRLLPRTFQTSSPSSPLSPPPPTHIHLRPCPPRPQGCEDTRDALWAAFVGRVRDNLHLLLALSPVGDAFRGRCRRFPSLLAATTVDWFSEWPEEALLSVSARSALLPLPPEHASPSLLIMV